MATIGLGRDIQQWLIRGMEHVALHTPPPDCLEMQAFLKLLRSAQLVTLLVGEPDPGDVLAVPRDSN